MEEERINLTFLQNPDTNNGRKLLKMDVVPEKAVNLEGGIDSNLHNSA